MQTNRKIGMAVGAVIAGAGIGVAGAYMLDLFPQPQPQVVDGGTGGPGGAFALTSNTGETVSDQTFRGKLMLVFFGFTHCPDVCPTTLADMHSVLEALGEDAEAVQPVFVSVDPQRDTPEVLDRYVALFDERIVGLTGTMEEIKAVADAYSVWFEHVPDEENPEYYLVNHTAAVFLMDQEGEFVRLFSFPTDTAEMVEGIRAELGSGSA